MKSMFSLLITSSSEPRYLLGTRWKREVYSIFSKLLDFEICDRTWRKLFVGSFTSRKKLIPVKKICIQSVKTVAHYHSERQAPVNCTETTTLANYFFSKLFRQQTQQSLLKSLLSTISRQLEWEPNQAGI